MEKSMIYAPVLIPTLCREQHLIRCVESLRKNTWARYTDVYVAVDYPKSESHRVGYEKICDYLAGDFPEFASLHVIKRPENYGSVRNMQALREDIEKKYDRYIRTDDDVEFSPNFLEYMDKTLMQYEDDEDVIAVTGYSFPIGWKASEGSTVIKEQVVCPVWGIGYWVKKRAVFAKDITDGGLLDIFEQSSRRVMFRRMTESAVCDYISGYTSGLYTKSGLFRITDITLRVYLGAKNKYVIAPILSKARNWGHDGSGVSCVDSARQTKKAQSFTYPYAQQPIDESDGFELIESQERYLKENRKMYTVFDKRSLRERIRPRLKWLCLKLLGKKRFVGLKVR